MRLALLLIVAVSFVAAQENILRLADGVVEVIRRAELRVHVRASFTGCVLHPSLLAIVTLCPLYSIVCLSLVY